MFELMGVIALVVVVLPLVILTIPIWGLKFKMEGHRKWVWTDNPKWVTYWQIRYGMCMSGKYIVPVLDVYESGPLLWKIRPCCLIW